MKVKRKDLPKAIKDVLTAVGYHAADISLDAAESFRAPGGAGEGNRAFVAVVNLSTGQYKIERGSWGGSNIFVQTLPDDLKQSIPIPVGSVVIIGQEGYVPDARIIAAPGTLAGALPAAPEASEREKQILAVFGGIKSGYRAEYLNTGRVSKEEISALINRGLLSQNKAGAIQVTTAGKNARGNTGAPSYETAWIRENPQAPKNDAGWKSHRLFRPQLVPVGEYSWKDDQITNSGSAAELIRRATEIHLSDRENIAIICLNTKNFPVSVHVAATGGLGSVQSDQSGLFRMAVADGAAAILISHNHPSGDPTPSSADRHFTSDVIKGGRILGIRLLDHIILGRDKYFSFLDEGILDTEPAK